jgi:hypothetical protein
MSAFADGCPIGLQSAKADFVNSLAAILIAGR